MRPLGPHETRSSAQLALAITLTPPQGARFVKLQVSGDNARYTLDGTTPSATVGLRIIQDAPQPTVVCVNETTTLQVIREGTLCELDFQFGH